MLAVSRNIRASWRPVPLFSQRVQIYCRFYASTNVKAGCYGLFGVFIETDLDLKVLVKSLSAER